MRVLVVGGSGYLGTLVLPFLARHHPLRVFDLRPPADSTLDYVQGSATDPAALAEAASGMDAVLYMAMGSHVRLNGDDWGLAESHADAFDVSVKGVYLALYAAHQAGIAHAVYTSSLSVYHQNGAGRYLSDEDLPPDSRHIYGFTKRLGEEVCRNACRSWGMSVNALRLYRKKSGRRKPLKASRSPGQRRKTRPAPCGRHWNTRRVSRHSPSAATTARRR